MTNVFLIYVTIIAIVTSAIINYNTVTAEVSPERLSKVQDNNEILYDTLTLSIPSPSGIIIQRMKSRGNDGTYTVGFLGFSQIDLRPTWKKIEIVDHVFDTAQCVDIIERAERVARINGGWMKSGRHQHYDTQDIPLNDLFSFGSPTDTTTADGDDFNRNFDPVSEQRAIDNILSKLRQFLERIARIYDLTSKTQHKEVVLSIADLFVTKYDATQPHLESHKDKSDFSFVLSLNDDFDGGGTYFALKNATLRTSVGSALVFNGQQYHSGVEITSNRSRYILAGFLDIVELDSNTGESSKWSAFQQLYNAQFDGFAYESGFRSSDLIVGIEVCEVDAVTGIVVKGMKEITLDTSDDEWLQAASSCEDVAPLDDRQFVVQRRRRRG